MDSPTQQDQTTPTNTNLNPFSSYNQETYQYNKVEQTTYTFSGQINREVTVGVDTIDLSNTARVFFIARRPCTITKILCSYQVGDPSTYIVVEKLVDGEAPGTGYPILPDPFDCTLPANVTQIRNIYDFVMSIQDRSLEIGERLAIKFVVPPTTLADVTITVEYQYK